MYWRSKLYLQYNVGGTSTRLCEERFGGAAMERRGEGERLE
jgi:hypothetical protein